MHVVSQRARGLRLREIRLVLAFDGQADVAFPCKLSGRHLHLSLRSSIPGPPVPLFTLRRPPRGRRRKTRGQDGSLLLSCRALSTPTKCRFIPAHNLLILSNFFSRRLKSAPPQADRFPTLVTAPQAVDAEVCPTLAGPEGVGRKFDEPIFVVAVLVVSGSREIDDEVLGEFGADGLSAFADTQ